MKKTILGAGWVTVLALWVSALGSLGACGQKGNLYLPPPPVAPSSTAVTVPAASALVPVPAGVVSQAR